MPGSFVKHPRETYVISVSYAGKAPTGAVLVSATWEATDVGSGGDASDSVLQSTTGVVEGELALGRVANGVMNRVYRLGVTATFDTGDVLHDNIYMSIGVDG